MERSQHVCSSTGIWKAVPRDGDASAALNARKLANGANAPEIKHRSWAEPWEPGCLKGQRDPRVLEIRDTRADLTICRGKVSFTGAEARVHILRGDYAKAAVL